MLHPLGASPAVRKICFENLHANTSFTSRLFARKSCRADESALTIVSISPLASRR